MRERATGGSLTTNGKNKTMLRIWGRGNSTNVKKVLWCADELGLDYEHVDAGGAFGIVGEPRYLALNPNGRIPCIEDDGVVVWESNAIVRYLAAKHDTGGLYATDAAERAIGDKWMDWATASVALPFRDIFWNVVRTAEADRDHALIERAMKTCSDLFTIADAALAKQPFLSGDRLRMGDIPLGCFAYAWFAMPITRPELPHLAKWYEGLSKRPAYQKRVMTPLT